MVFPFIKIELALEGIRGIRNSDRSQRMRSIQYDKSAFFGMSDLAYRFLPYKLVVIVIHPPNGPLQACKKHPLPFHGCNLHSK